MEDVREIPSLDEVEWKAFEIKDLFERFERGRIGSISGEKEDAGGMPYVGAAYRNNGVLGFYSGCTDKVQSGNCIVFVCNGQGSVGCTLYRESDCIATTSVTLGYAPWVNRYTGLFFSVCASMNRSRYSFGYSRKGARLFREQVMLPITSDGELDWDFMEQYVKKKMDEML